MNKSQFKEEFAETFSKTIAFNPVFAKISGSANAGLFLSQLFYWTGRGSINDEWIHKTQKEWENETFLTAAEQKTARLQLRKIGVLHELPMRELALEIQMNKTARFSRELCYRINFDALRTCLCFQNNSQIIVVDETQEIADRPAENRRPAPQKSTDGEAHSIHLCTQITAQSSFRKHDDAAEKKLLVIIKNIEDQVRYEALQNAYGLEAVQRAEEMTLAGGNRLYVSNISKNLKSFISLNENQNEKDNKFYDDNFIDPEIRAVQLAALKHSEYIIGAARRC